MARDHLLVIDQGTTSTRAVIYDPDLRVVGQGQVEVLPSYPQPGWVEHDPEALIASVASQVTLALLDAGVKADRIAAIGLTNQRETTIVWERASGRPVWPALVWQDRRTAEVCQQLHEQSHWVTPLTGLVVDPYFSATKIAWILDHVPRARERAEAGELAAGTVDSFLIWHLTGGRRHVTDVTNASRTLLMELQSGVWSERLCQLFAVPLGILPTILPSTGDFGATEGLDYLPDGIPIAGVVGDQQGSLVGQGCLEPGQAKCTFGTGAFLLAHTGSRCVASRHGLVTTRAASLDAEPRFALEGSVFIAGAAVQWFRDGLKAIGAAPEIGELALAASPSSELVFVPALTGMGAPHWVPAARGTLFGLTRATTLADVARAILEGVALQITDLIEAVQNDLGGPLAELRADGGMARSDPFLQFQADILGRPIRRSPATESTALGAGLLAGLGIGLWPDQPTALERLQAGGRLFLPERDDAWRRQMHDRWRHAVESVIRHYS